MKIQSLAQVLSAAVIALGVTAIINQPSYGQDTSTITQPNRLRDTTFSCEKDNDGTFTTFAESSARGGKIAIISWKTQVNRQFPPKTRCEEVTKRFQTYYENGTLNYITTGIMNRQPVVCVTSTVGGRCTSLLFTLVNQNNRQSASEVLQKLFNLSAAAAGTLPPVLESGDTGSNEDTSTAPIYIDMRDYLNKAPLVGVNSPSSQPPVTPSRN